MTAGGGTIFLVEGIGTALMNCVLLYSLTCNVTRLKSVLYVPSLSFVGILECIQVARLFYVYSW